MKITAIFAIIIGWTNAFAKENEDIPGADNYAARSLRMSNEDYLSLGLEEESSEQSTMRRLLCTNLREPLFDAIQEGNVGINWNSGRKSFYKQWEKKYNRNRIGGDDSWYDVVYGSTGLGCGNCPTVYELGQMNKAARKACNKAQASCDGDDVVKTIDDYISGVCDTMKPTARPTNEPTARPTNEPTARPTKKPTARPTKEPTARPTKAPTAKPTARPTKAPTASPTAKPTARPTMAPTARPTMAPTARPTHAPTTEAPTHAPTTEAPTPEIPVLLKDPNVFEGEYDNEGFVLLLRQGLGILPGRDTDIGVRHLTGSTTTVDHNLVIRLVLKRNPGKDSDYYETHLRHAVVWGFKRYRDQPAKSVSVYFIEDVTVPCGEGDCGPECDEWTYRYNGEGTVTHFCKQCAVYDVYEITIGLGDGISGTGMCYHHDEVSWVQDHFENKKPLHYEFEHTYAKTFKVEGSGRYEMRRKFERFHDCNVKKGYGECECDGVTYLQEIEFWKMPHGHNGGHFTTEACLYDGTGQIVGECAWTTSPWANISTLSFSSDEVTTGPQHVQVKVWEGGQVVGKAVVGGIRLNPIGGSEIFEIPCIGTGTGLGVFELEQYVVYKDTTGIEIDIVMHSVTMEKASRSCESGLAFDFIPDPSPSSCSAPYDTTLVPPTVRPLMALKVVDEDEEPVVIEKFQMMAFWDCGSMDVLQDDTVETPRIMATGAAVRENVLYGYSDHGIATDPGITYRELIRDVGGTLGIVDLSWDAVFKETGAKLDTACAFSFLIHTANGTNCKPMGMDYSIEAMYLVEEGDNKYDMSNYMHMICDGENTDKIRLELYDQ